MRPLGEPREYNMWRCSKCGEDHEDAFDACWNCGTEKNDQAPEQVEPEQKTSISVDLDSGPPDVHLVARGRAILLVLIGTFLVLDLIWTFATYWQSQTPSWTDIMDYGLTYGLLYAVWRGYTWAITLTKILTAINVILSPIIGGLLLSNMIRPHFTMVELLAGVVQSGVLWVCLTRSKSINEFLRHQRQVRTKGIAAMTGNRRNVVVLTPDAAELTHKTITDRGFSPETALRVVLGKGDNSQIGVEYDVPLDDERDWVGESSGVVVLVEKAIASQLEGLTIDARDGQYAFNMPNSATKRASESEG